MSSAFAVLFNLAIQIQSDPNHATLTFHHDPDYVAVRTRLERAILQFVMLGEGMESHWRLLRIFCLNYIDRARPAVHEDVLRKILTKIEADYRNEVDRIEALAQLQASQLRGSRTGEFVRALSFITSMAPSPALGNLNYLEWLDIRWLIWVGQSFEDVDETALLSDLDVLSLDPATKIPGMDLPLSANLMAHMGLPVFAMPDPHVVPVMRLLQLSVESRNAARHAFAASIRISKIEREALRSAPDFTWLENVGGLTPRYLDRLIYLIGSDNFNLDGVKKKAAAPQRLALMRKSLFQAGLLDGRYADGLHD